MRMISRTAALLTTGLACMLLSLAANAATISVASYGLKYGTSGAPTGKVHYSGAVSSSIYAGEFRLTLDDGSKLDAFCIDVTNTLKKGTYTEQSDAPAPGLDFARVGKLYDHYYHLATDVHSTSAFQLALWAIVYGSATSNSTSFGSAKATADQWLDSLAGKDALGLYKFTVLEPKNPTNNQRLLTVAKVPEPGTLALLGAGLLAAGALRRRRLH